MQRAVNQSERRVFGRRTSAIHALVRIPGRPAEPCIVRNFSDGGALLEFTVEIELPPRFRLIVDAKGVDTLCEPRHKDGLLIGARFLEAGAGEAFFDEAAAGVAPLDDADFATATTPTSPMPIRTRPTIIIPGHEQRRTMLGHGG